MSYTCCLLLLEGWRVTDSTWLLGCSGSWQTACLLWADRGAPIPRPDGVTWVGNSTPQTSMHGILFVRPLVVPWLVFLRLAWCLCGLDMFFLCLLFGVSLSCVVFPFSGDICVCFVFSCGVPLLLLWGFSVSCLVFVVYHLVFLCIGRCVFGKLFDFYVYVTCVSLCLCLVFLCLLVGASVSCVVFLDVVLAWCVFVWCGAPVFSWKLHVQIIQPGMKYRFHSRHFQLQTAGRRMARSRSWVTW